MAVLGKIRSHGVMLLVVVGLALLAFIVGDFLNNSSSFFRKSQETVAVIAGEDININDYSASIEQMVEVYKIETGQSDLSEDVMNQLRTSVWESLVNEKILNAQAKEVGLAVSADELSDYLIGNKTHQLISQRRAFAGENGQFSRPALVQFLNSLEQTPENEEMRQQIAKYKSYWLFWEKTVKNSVLQEKYNALISKTITANSLDAKMNFEASKTSYDVNYVVQPYFTVSDSAVSVSNSEIKDLYKKQKEQFKQEANCTLNYVVFDVKPSNDDFKKAETTMNTLSTEFKTTPDIIGFVNSNSEVRYNANGYSETNVPSNLKDFAFGSAAGAIVGPIFNVDTYTMAKVVETGIMHSDSVRLRHIFLTKNDESKSDSLISVINAGGNFAELAMKYSAVKQTASNGGEIGWIVEEMQGMDKDLITKAFSSPANGIFTMKNEQGTQIMQVMEKTPARRKVRLAILEIKVSTSNTTVSKIYNEAKQFAAELTGDKFDQKAKEKSYSVRTATDLFKTTDKIADIAQSRQIIRWAFGNDKDDVSDVYDCGNQFVVAKVTEINEKGYKSVEKVTDQLKAELIRDKKAELIIKNLTAQLSKTPSIETLATTIGVELKNAPAVNFSAYQFGVAGAEPAVIGKVSALAANKVSAPIKGLAGVYVVQALNPQVNPAPFDAKMQIMQFNSRMSYSLPYMIIQDLKDNADIKDNRLNFF
jgi:peptidyl-prolyl cis-trans isomerase D